MSRSDILLNLKQGIYPNRLLNPRHLEWYGQNSGKRDHMVVIGTNVWVRTKSPMPYKKIGFVKSIQCIEPGDKLTKRPAKYHIEIELLSPDNEVTIERAYTDKIITSTVLRSIGYPESEIHRTRHFGEGIYSM